MHDEAETRRVTVFGGTGFLGRRVARHLRAKGLEIRVAVRHPERAPKLFGPSSGITARRADVREEKSVAAAVDASDAVVNAVSLYLEHETTFQAVHVEAARRVARLCRIHGVRQLVHVSGLGSDPASPSRYIRARGRGELAVREEFPRAIIVRPSVMFGPDDAFLTTLVQIVRWLPVLPLFGRGRVRLQPVFVEDVAEAIARILTTAAPAGQTYELGGPFTYSYRQLVEEVAATLPARRVLLPMPLVAWKGLAAAAEHTTGGLTVNQVELMEHDNVPTGGHSIGELRIEPTSVEQLLPQVIHAGQAWRGSHR